MSDRRPAAAPANAAAERVRKGAAEPNVVPMRARKVHCPDCPLKTRCLPVDLDRAEIRQFDALVTGQRRLHRGDTLFRAGASFEALYPVRCGTLKTSILAEDGREQVAGYHLVGEVLGLDGIATDSHACTANALEDAEVCIVPFAEVETMMQTSSDLRRTLRHLLAREVTRNHGQMLLLGSMRAEERVAAFLLDLAERYRQRGYSASEFVLRMTREEIGSFLGLKLETVSRVFSRLQDDGLIQTQGRAVKLLDPPMLHQLIGRDPSPTVR